MHLLLKMILNLHTSNRQISNVRIALSCSSELSDIMNIDYSPSMLYARFPDISVSEVSFLHYWHSFKKELKKHNYIEFASPLPQELISFIGVINTHVIFPDGSESTISFSAEPYTPKILLDIAGSCISLNPQEPSLLVLHTIPMAIHKNEFTPLCIPFENKIIEKLYNTDRVSIPNTECSFLINALQHSPTALKKMLVTPKITKSSKIDPVLNFQFNTENKKYEISLFLEAIVDNSKHRFPLNLETTQQFLKSQLEFAINGPNNTALVIDEKNPIRHQINTIIEASFQNFYSILGEIEDNKIITDDTSNVFERFLPAISKDIDIYQENKKNKLEFVLTQEKPNIKIAHNNNTPLFGSIDWLSVSFSYNHHQLKLSLQQLEQIIQQGFVEIDNQLIAIPESDLNPIKKLLELRTPVTVDNLQIKASFLPWILSLYPEAQIPEEWQELKHFISEGTVPSISLPQYSEDTLRNYQKIGVQRLALLNKFGFGAILADEMGLGKTLQILALLDMNHLEEKILIVTPSSLMFNWAIEINKFYPNRFKVLIVHGTKESRHKQLSEIDKYDMIITSYHTLGFDIEYYRDHHFKYCIIDEAQHIKNKNSKRAKSVKSINATLRIAVSGTPLENNISEFWSIFDFIMPGFLGTAKDFHKHFEEPLQSFDQTKRKETLSKLYNMCSAFIIRRTKEKVYKELPSKIEQTIITELTTQQKSLYLKTLSSVKDHFHTLVQENTFNQNRIDFLSALTKLRQITLHPALLYPELASMDSSLYSSKMTALLELLSESLESGHRILIFSQFVSMLYLIRQELNTRNIEHLYIDGKTPNRVELTEEFNTGSVPVFLISLRAGGIGLNLTGADTVILFDPWWNPSVENQAIDRAHRIGQNKVVNVYRIMTKGTIEEKIYHLQQKKNFLFDNIMQENSDFGKFSSEELLLLLSIDDNLHQ